VGVLQPSAECMSINSSQSTTKLDCRHQTPVTTRNLQPGQVGNAYQLLSYKIKLLHQAGCLGVGCCLLPVPHGSLLPVSITCGSAMPRMPALGALLPAPRAPLSVPKLLLYCSTAGLGPAQVLPAAPAAAAGDAPAVGSVNKPGCSCCMTAGWKGSMAWRQQQTQQQCQCHVHSARRVCYNTY
jgi:hypothetical protein